MQELMREIVLQDYPGFVVLGKSGFWDVWPTMKPEKRLEVLDDQERMFTDIVMEDFVKVRGWLQKCPKTKHLNRTIGTSYTLKHVAEGYIGYSSNGVFIAAAIAEGFKVQRALLSLNAWLNVSSKFVRQQFRDKPRW